MSKSDKEKLADIVTRLVRFESPEVSKAAAPARRRIAAILKVAADAVREVVDGVK